MRGRRRTNSTECLGLGLGITAGLGITLGIGATACADGDESPDRFVRSHDISPSSSLPPTLHPTPVTTPTLPKKKVNGKKSLSDTGVCIF